MPDVKIAYPSCGYESQEDAVEIREAQLKDFIVRDISETHYRAGATLVLGFQDGPTGYAKVEIGKGVNLPKGTSLEDAREMVLKALLMFLSDATASASSYDQVADKVAASDRPIVRT